jgi:hypothetical protein
LLGRVASVARGTFWDTCSAAHGNETGSYSGRDGPGLSSSVAGTEAWTWTRVAFAGNAQHARLFGRDIRHMLLLGVLAAAARLEQGEGVDRDSAEAEDKMKTKKKTSVLDR